MNDELHNKVVKFFYDHEELFIAIMNKTPYQSDGWDYEIEVVKEFLTANQSCYCGNIYNLSVIHRDDGPCHYPDHKEPEQERNALPKAMNVVIAAMQADPSYAWSWHCNVAMAYVDAGGNHGVANQGAARFMKLLANVEPAHDILPTQTPDAKLKEPEQEPVACVYKATTKKGEVAHFGEYSAAKAWAGWGTVERVSLKTLTLISKSTNPCPTCEALARSVMLDQTSHDTTPPQRKPLTDEQIEALRKQNSEGRGAGWRFNFEGFARAIEAAHGIKGEA